MDAAYTRTFTVIFFNQSLTSQSNFKVSVEFCANEHGLNCRLNF